MAAHPGVLLVDLLATDVPCQPKVSDLENKALGYEDIPGCQVTVDNLWQEGGGREWFVVGHAIWLPQEGGCVAAPGGQQLSRQHTFSHHTPAISLRAGQ